MSESGANNGSQNDIQRHFIDFYEGRIFFFEEIFHDVIANKKSKSEEQSVVADFERTQPKHYWINIPDNVIQHKYLLLF